ncbi:MAG: hydroxymethylglutaryl-CoA reductase, degradative [archaeon]
MLDPRLEKFYKKTVEERRKIINEIAGLNDQQIAVLQKTGALGIDIADRMIENVIGTFELPLGVATNFVINKKEVLVPMVLEEPSVVAAASNAAKLSEGFTATATEPLMIGQIQLLGVNDFEKARHKILDHKGELLNLANSQDSTLVKFGGGAREIEIRAVGEEEKMVVVHLIVDVRDAMGANAINTMCEKIAPRIEELSGGKACLRIISNLATHRLASARTVWKKENIGEKTIDAILSAYEFAKADIYRCATNNKGIMNGIDSVVIATGNDWRAVEAGAHGYAAFEGDYRPLAKYCQDKKGDLVGEITLPLAVGLVGGATKTHPTAQVSLKILGVKTAQELAQIIACVGLANNFAALRALSTVGIQTGHMKLHAKNIAVIAGAKGKQIDHIAKQMAGEKNISVARAKELLEK